LRRRPVGNRLLGKAQFIPRSLLLRITHIS
jgi:hypothetical protein